MFFEEDFLDDESNQSILYGYFFWQSAEIYRNSMNSFIDNELSSEEFVARVFFQLFNNMEECRSLEKDFDRQSKLELKPEMFQFAMIIYDFYSTLQAFDDGAITENKLRQVIQNDILPKAEKYFNNKI